MQAQYPPAFEREMGCSEAEWLQALPGAVAPHPVEVGSGTARVTIDAGALALAWQVLPPRRIALLRLPRLSVRFAFERVADEARQRFMRRFDLCMQRGGG